jgi:hypothetical protein
MTTRNLNHPIIFSIGVIPQNRKAKLGRNGGIVKEGLSTKKELAHLYI